MEDDRSTNGHPRGATHTKKVPPLDYTQLRLLAECAVGITDENVDFYFRMNGALEKQGRNKDGVEHKLEDYTVVVPAFDPEKYPANEVTLKIGPKPPVEQGEDPRVGVADAMFWSDAAVQKFVFPYVASCAGTGAAAALQQLQQAWNFYPGEQVTVYALVHVNKFAPNVPLTLEKAFWVVYEEMVGGVGQPPLKTLPLDEFIARYPGTGPDPFPRVAKGRVDYHRGTSHRRPQHPDYVVLRALAEWACSIRDQPVYFRFRPDEYGFTGPYKHLPHVHPGDIVVPVQTPTVPEGRPQLDGVWFNAGSNSVPTNLAHTGDALFWSTGAIEQFLYPYYASKGGLQALESLTRMAYVWTGQVPKTFSPTGETPPSFAAFDATGGAGTDGADGTDGAAAEIESGDRVFALIHLYTSEWVEETEERSAGAEEVMLAGTRRLHTRVDPEQEMGAVAVDGSVTRLHHFKGALAAR